MDNRFRLMSLVLLTMLVVLGGCSDSSKRGSTANLHTEPSGGIAAYIGGEPITIDELMLEAQADMNQIELEKNRRLIQTLDRMVAERLLQREAEERGIAGDEILRLEMEQRVSEPTDADILDFYEKNRHQVGDRSVEQLRAIIIKQLKQDSEKKEKVAFLDRLKAKAGYQLMIPEPRLHVSVPEGEPSWGPEDSAVTVVEFSDFQCSFCKKAHSDVQQMLAEYGDRIRFVYRDFPLQSVHPRAFPAAAAARCAHEQERYWDYHNSLWLAPGDLSDDDLKLRAGQLGLDETRFAECYDSGRMNEVVQTSFDEGRSLGITGTPTFFINGRVFRGSQDYSDLKKAIEEELAKADA